MLHVPSLPQALDRGLRKKKDTWGDDRVHVSDLAVAIGEKCPRQLWLRIRGAKKKELSTGQLLMFDHGHRIHERLVEVMDTALPLGWHIFHVEKGVRIGDVTGRLDIMLKHALGSRVVVDFKTLRGRAFGYLEEVRPAHKLQVQSYSMAVNADGGLVFYVDREGQNKPKQFFVERDDAKVKWAIAETLEVAHGEQPGILLPQLVISKNKGPDSVKLKMPWQCEYCEYIDISCPGALPYEDRNNGIIGYLDGETFKPKGKKDYSAIVAELKGGDTACPF